MSKIVDFLNKEEKTTRGQQLIVAGCLFGLWALNNSLIKKSEESRRRVHNYETMNDELELKLISEKLRNEKLQTQIDELEKIED